jgi:starch phosphorylase
VLVNGGLNLSELDGWWAEAYSPEVGWALGDGREHDADPSWDRHEAEELYRLLEQEVVPMFYRTGADGIPSQWVARMRESMARLTPWFSTNRMLREYTERYYLPGAADFRRRSGDHCAVAGELQQWQRQLREQWDSVRFGHIEHREQGNRWQFELLVYLGDLNPDAVRVELYAEGGDDAAPRRISLHRDSAAAGAVNAHIYRGGVEKKRPADHYTARVIPHHEAAVLPAELPLIRWPH